MDEYRLPKLDDGAQNGWPDWAVLWPDRAWVIELKTEKASHRDDQLPYYLYLATAAHPGSRVDLTYITGPLAKPGHALVQGQRDSHLTWESVLPLLEVAWADDPRPEVAAYVEAVRTVIQNLDVLSPTAQRAIMLDQSREPNPVAAPAGMQETVDDDTTAPDRAPEELVDLPSATDDLLSLARSTAADGRQRGVGAMGPTDLEELRDTAYQKIAELPLDGATRFVLPWLWQASNTGGRALSVEGAESPGVLVLGKSDLGTFLGRLVGLG